MTHEVIVTLRAQEQLEDSYQWWAENRSREQANRWYNAFAHGLASLAESPMRWPESPESRAFPYEIRDFFFGAGRKPTHRAGFTIRDRTVVILAVRHLAQREI